MTLVQELTNMYIGVDVHKNSCYIAALNEAGEKQVF